MAPPDATILLAWTSNYEDLTPLAAYIVPLYPDFMALKDQWHRRVSSVKRYPPAVMSRRITYIRNDYLRCNLSSARPFTRRADAYWPLHRHVP